MFMADDGKNGGEVQPITQQPDGGEKGGGSIYRDYGTILNHCSNSDKNDGEITDVMPSAPVMMIDNGTVDLSLNNAFGLTPSQEASLQMFTQFAQSGFFIQQVADLVEGIIGEEHGCLLNCCLGEKANKYRISPANDHGNLLLMAKELPKSTCCMPHRLMGNDRPFTIVILPAGGPQIPLLTIKKDVNKFCFVCCAKCYQLCAKGCKCCGLNNAVDVYIGDEERLIGSVRKKACCDPGGPTFYVKETMITSGQTLYEMDGPCPCCWCQCHCFCCGNDITFDIQDQRNGMKVGELNKKFSGYCKEKMTDADNFELRFFNNFMPRAPTEVALLLAATFLIDFKYFED